MRGFGRGAGLAGRAAWPHLHQALELRAGQQDLVRFHAEEFAQAAQGVAAGAETPAEVAVELGAVDLQAPAHVGDRRVVAAQQPQVAGEVFVHGVQVKEVWRTLAHILLHWAPDCGAAANPPEGQALFKCASLPGQLACAHAASIQQGDAHPCERFTARHAPSGPLH
ncbi:hypothetical protein D9M69_583850 [compost metagenome]